MTTPRLASAKKASALRVQVVEATVTHEDLTAAALEQNIAFASLPNQCLMLYGYGNVTEAFSGGGATSVTMDLGIYGGIGHGEEYAKNLDVAVTGLKAKDPAGTVGSLGDSANLRIQSDVNVDTLTAGSVTCYLYFIDLAQV